VLKSIHQTLGIGLALLWWRWCNCLWMVLYVHE